MFKKLFQNKYAKWFLLLLLITGLFIADYRLHNYYNTEGYRGEIKKEKKIGEYRIACFGESTTFGYGVKVNEAWPAQLENLLHSKGNFSVVNLGANNQGIYGISHDVEYYDYLQYDMAILYHGETDRDVNRLSEKNFRGGDLLFSLFGYKTILPFYAKEAFRRIMPSATNGEVTFTENKKNNNRRINRYYEVTNEMAKNMRAKNQQPYKEYLLKLEETLQNLLTKNKKVVLVCQPGIYESIQQEEVRKLIAHKFANKVSYINLSNLFENIEEVSIDCVHLNPQGYKKVAESLCDSLLKIIAHQ